MFRFLLCPAVVAVGLLGSAAATTAAADQASAAMLASFEGRTVDLSKGWGAAQACVEIDGALSCYRSEAEMDVAHPELGVSPSAAKPADGVVPMAECSSSLRLYDGTNYATPMITLTTRQTVHNLSNYGFDKKTSSYRVGACAARLHNAANLGGSKYPGPTSANSSSATMQSGWKNTISSARLD